AGRHWSAVTHGSLDALCRPLTLFSCVRSDVTQPSAPTLQASRALIESAVTNDVTAGGHIVPVTTQTITYANHASAINNALATTMRAVRSPKANAMAATIAK